MLFCLFASLFNSALLTLSLLWIEVFHHMEEHAFRCGQNRNTVCCYTFLPFFTVSEYFVCYADIKAGSYGLLFFNFKYNRVIIGQHASY
jgi:hypothetical protein